MSEISFSKEEKREKKTYYTYIIKRCKKDLFHMLCNEHNANQQDWKIFHIFIRYAHAHGSSVYRLFLPFRSHVQVLWGT